MNVLCNAVVWYYCIENRGITNACEAHVDGRYVKRKTPANCHHKEDMMQSSYGRYKIKDLDSLEEMIQLLNKSPDEQLRQWMTGCITHIATHDSLEQANNFFAYSSGPISRPAHCVNEIVQRSIDWLNVTYDMDMNRGMSSGGQFNIENTFSKN